MLHNKRKWWVLAPFVFVGAVLLVGWVIMTLWNIILVPLLHVGVITFWQGLGLLVLSRLLFGGFGGRGGKHCCGSHKGHYWKEKWSSMTDEEKEKFKEEWKSRCGKMSWGNKASKDQ